jgi:glycosyltransferase involved in cell wall biosynthesis
VEALARLLRDPELRDQLGARGRAKVLADFDVNASARQLRAVLGDFAAPARS